MLRYTKYEELDEYKKAAVDDKSIESRTDAAAKGWGLDKLIDDESWEVRYAVAYRGYGLDKLVNDKDHRVRWAVVMQRDEDVPLDTLVDDPHERVRMGVVLRGYGLDKLIDDKEEAVRALVDGYLEQRGLTIEQWIEENPRRCALKENRG